MKRLCWVEKVFGAALEQPNTTILSLIKDPEQARFKERIGEVILVMLCCLARFIKLF